MSLPTTPSFRLDGKRALVTGAGRGIGLAAASAFAEAGAHVTLMARSRDEIESAAEQIGKRGGSADAVAADVTELDGFEEAVQGAAPYDIFFNNAGMNRPQPFIEVSVENYDTIMGLNVRAAFFAAQAVARRLVAAQKPGSIINMSSQMGHVGGAGRSVYCASKWAVENYDTIMGLNVRAAFFAAQAVARRLVAAQKPGSIINMSSQMGHVGAAGRTVYCASKWAIEGLTKAMAIELGEHRIRVNTICPTFIETPMTRPFLADPAFKDRVLSKIKLGRLGAVEDLMGALVFLASDASALMTGSALLVDGGWTAE